ncbi:conserved Plasmodium protein, unknown function [Plasmodium berghei]|uniref:EGF-like domain-containing protein n=2 Tax=Plasmodium berghei TaxID=5821 RepID=A0A509AQ90_PLABA|nr:conserved Plasmodium protein, unknown function [Plasmodium berghei ANKA]CXI72334.1 conserved Plasmodium protein, unknown function [Plasmodium berghei]SCM24394.1 conserved Plasmodium protein, unknown function [Plasmodium berghei]SCN27050.1 conserved Plasmodium protein, unknown function [Plasmodium berghei]SCO61526.1 conserved Plasmodium protein, unknown function [Plasmodium berghei]SCO63472.1 conserved Plasmodium protein, unknown function [Plasmodium berghei]|eukprot:XP_034422684.1 conserved Plasmodium protein, unknown function [Plasmodium berghei ANKA]
MFTFFFFLLTMYLLFATRVVNVKAQSEGIIKTKSIEISYDENSRHLYIDSINKENCNKQKYYINDQCKIDNSMENNSENSIISCLNEDKCSDILTYIYENNGMRIVHEKNYYKFPFYDNLSYEIMGCNKIVYLNKNIKCACCIEDQNNGLEENTEEPLIDLAKIKIENLYNFKECKCILNYQLKKIEIINSNKCDNFNCAGGFCTIQLNGQPYCSCFENYYFDKKLNSCTKHEQKIQKNDDDSVPKSLLSDPINDPQIFDQAEDANNHKFTGQPEDTLKNNDANVLVPNHLNKIVQNPNLQDCQEGRLTDETSKFKKRNENNENNTKENICLRLECFINSNKPECVCLNKNGDKISNNIFDVSNISVCTLNDINCDYGICNNILNRNELGCICDKNYKYNPSLKTCISSSKIHIFNFIILFLLFLLSFI